MSFMIVPHNEAHIVSIQLSRFIIWFTIGIITLILFSSVMSWQLQTRIEPTVETLHDRHDSLDKERNLYLSKLEAMNEQHEYLKRELYDILSEIEMDPNNLIFLQESTLLHSRAEDEIEAERKFLISYDEKKEEIAYSGMDITALLPSKDKAIGEDFNFYPEVIDYRVVSLKVQQITEAISSTKKFLYEQDNVQRKLPYFWPTVGGHFTSFYGPRLSPFGYKTDFHYGVDLANPIGTPIYSAAEGIVEMAVYSNSGYGMHVQVAHGYGFATMYAHMNSIYVRSGQMVSKGQVIGTVGNTGHSTGPHLHYEVHIYGEKVNPIHYMNF